MAVSEKRLLRLGEEMDRLHAMRVFVKAADSGGFAAAARHLNMSPPAVTRAIAMLEEHIGGRLFTRTTRTIRLTDIGRRYLVDCRRILTDLAEAEASAAGRHSSPSGPLVVTAPTLFGQYHVMPILMDYLDQHPAVRAQAMFVDRVTNIVEEGIDVAIRIGNLPDSSHSAIRIGSVRRVICGSPAYFERHGYPSKPDELIRHRIVAATLGSSSSPVMWRFGGPGSVSVAIDSPLQCHTIDSAIAAARAGWGLTRVLSYQIGPAVAAGDLEIILSDHEEPPMPVHVVHHEGRRASATVRGFVDIAVARLRANPDIG